MKCPSRIPRWEIFSCIRRRPDAPDAQDMQYANRMRGTLHRGEYKWGSVATIFARFSPFILSLAYIECFQFAVILLAFN